MEYTLALAKRFDQFLSDSPSPSPTPHAGHFARHLLAPFDAMEEFVCGAALRESVAALWESSGVPEAPAVLFIDRRGGKLGGNVAATLIELLSRQAPGASLVYVGFGMPPRGVGRLLQAMLVRKGTETGVAVNVVSAARAAEEFQPDEAALRALLSGAALVISFAPPGSAALLPHDAEQRDAWVTAAHVNVLSFPDPEHVVADLPRLEKVLGHDPGFKHLRLWVQVREAHQWTVAGDCRVGELGDAQAQLWPLIDHAQRLPWRLLMVPEAHDAPVGTPLHCPSVGAVSDGASDVGIRVARVIPAGGHFVAVGRGVRA